MNPERRETVSRRVEFHLPDRGADHPNVSIHMPYENRDMVDVYGGEGLLGNVLRVRLEDLEAVVAAARRESATRPEGTSSQ